MSERIMKLWLIILYLIVGCIFSGASSAWVENHCHTLDGKPVEVTMTDDLELTLGWGLLVPSAVVSLLVGAPNRHLCQ